MIQKNKQTEQNDRKFGDSVLEGFWGLYSKEMKNKKLITGNSEFLEVYPTLICIHGFQYRFVKIYT